MKQPLNILYIEDDPLWLATIPALLQNLPTVTRVDTARSGAQALALAAAVPPTVVILDLILPDFDGLQLARRLSAGSPAPRILLLTARHDAVALTAASENHIAGLLWKADDTLARLPTAIGALAAGGAFSPPEVRDATRRFRADPDAFFKILSPREQELLPFIGRGQPDEEIAGLLSLSVHTVSSHRHHIMRKLGLHSTPQLMQWAVAQGFVALGPRPTPPGLRTA